MSNGLIKRTEDLPEGGFAAIVKVRGVLLPPKRVPSRYKESLYKTIPDDQLEITVEDAEILEMLGNQPAPELRDGKFTFWLNYAPPVQSPTKQTRNFFTRGFASSAQALWDKREPEAKKGWLDFVGQVVCLEKKPVLLMTVPQENTEERKEVWQTNFIFVEDSDTAPVDIDAYVRESLIGKNKATALRWLVMDAKVRRNPKYKEALNNDTLAELLELEVHDGIFSAKETAESAGKVA